MTSGHRTPHGATIQDVEHIVILMQENRAFDHYFGTLPVRRLAGIASARWIAGGNRDKTPAAPTALVEFLKKRRLL